MEDQIENVVNAIKIKSATTISKNEHIFINYVKEYQENGNPHLHGTIMTQERITPSLQGSWEQMLKRWYGKSEIWYTGSGNKYHKNDHFEGSWQQYLKKDNPENYESVMVFKNEVHDLEGNLRRWQVREYLEV